jgi:heme/copper-type cytochrome/quinol oxidase subunit 2
MHDIFTNLYPLRREIERNSPLHLAIVVLVVTILTILILLYLLYRCRQRRKVSKSTRNVQEKV